MTLYDYMITAKEHGSVVLAAVLLAMTAIQISPLKLDPWTRFNKWLSKTLYKDINDKLDSIETKLNNHIVSEQRAKILDFASAVGEGKRKYSKEQFEQIMADCDNYETFCIENKINNSVAEASIKLIKESYHIKLATNDFVNEKEDIA